jgi:hypothetical protein
MHKLLVVLALILTTMVVNSGEAAATRISTAAANTTCQGSWTKMPSRICTWCEKGLLGARRCHWIGCGNAGCNYIIVGGGGTRASRIVLNDCIKNYDRCRRGCTYYPWHPDSVLPPPPAGSPLEAQQCKNRCDANHFVCVDAAMDLSRR